MNKQGATIMSEPATGSAAVVFGGGAIVGLLAAVVAISLTPPRSRIELAGMVSAAFASSCFVGPLVIEYLQLTHYGFQAQLGVCFMCAAPAWLICRIVSNQLQRWRDAKNPLSTITRDVREARRG